MDQLYDPSQTQILGPSSKRSPEAEQAINRAQQGGARHHDHQIQDDLNRTNPLAVPRSRGDRHQERQHRQDYTQDDLSRTNPHAVPSYFGEPQDHYHQRHHQQHQYHHQHQHEHQQARKKASGTGAPPAPKPGIRNVLDQFGFDRAYEQVQTAVGQLCTVVGYFLRTPTFPSLDDPEGMDDPARGPGRTARGKTEDAYLPHQAVAWGCEASGPLSSADEYEIFDC